MGSTESSTRKISIENDEDLKENSSFPQTIKVKKINNPNHQTPEISLEKVDNSNIGVSENESEDKDEYKDGDVKSTKEIPKMKNELSEKELNLQHVQMLKTNKENWDKKIQNLKEKHDKIYSDYIEEYQKAVKDNSPKEQKKKNAVPCKDFKEKVLKCYQKNKTETLVCSEIVQEYMKCLDNARCDVMEKK
ncbi:MICOS complex subunit MIC19 [Nilaparvata lugens]|uniref:MICOS complex subunit MIC19 n=1 Tax=Nilaparvata lugens TaxID=108931 RepID=UPI000B99131E|nr:MICOS complex subunit MIC19 [Nilaparvata lugens]